MATIIQITDAPSAKAQALAAETVTRDAVDRVLVAVNDMLENIDTLALHYPEQALGLLRSAHVMKQGWDGAVASLLEIRAQKLSTSVRHSAPLPRSG